MVPKSCKARRDKCTKKVERIRQIVVIAARPSPFRGGTIKNRLFVLTFFGRESGFRSGHSLPKVFCAGGKRASFRAKTDKSADCSDKDLVKNRFILPKDENNFFRAFGTGFEECRVSRSQNRHTPRRERRRPASAARKARCFPENLIYKQIKN